MDRDTRISGLGGQQNTDKCVVIRSSLDELWHGHLGKLRSEIYQ